MAGQYFSDPRPFNGVGNHSGLMSMDELFYGRYEPIPYWMDQRMPEPASFQDYFPMHKQMATIGRPELPMGVQQYVQREANTMAYKRPEVRDDSYTDMYSKRSPHYFPGDGGPMVAFGAPPGMRDPRGQTQDDTWVHYPLTPHGRGMGPQQQQGVLRDRRDDEREYQQMDSSMMRRANNNSQSLGNGSNMESSNQFRNERNGRTNGMATKQRYSQLESSDDDDDDEYENVNRNGIVWATKNASNQGQQHGRYHKLDNHDYDTNFRGSTNAQNMSSKKSSGGQQSYGSFDSGKKFGKFSQSKVSKMLGFRDGGNNSSDEDEGYNYSQKGGFKGQLTTQGAAKPANHPHSHGGHGLNSSLQSFGQQPVQQMNYSTGSQSKTVELRVPICCDNCERKVRACLEYMDGVESVLCDQWNKKVIVYGNAKAENILKRVRRVKKGSELWQQAKQLRY